MAKSFKFIGIALLVSLACAVAIGLFGRVSGEEFSPQRFTVRRFSYYQLPFVGTQLTPVSLSKSSRGNIALSTHLRKKQLVGQGSPTLNWDIVRMNQVGGVTSGDSEILLKYLEQPGARGSENWLMWTKNQKHRDIVALFWPLIAKMAEEELYILMPDVFDAAKAAKSSEDFVNHVRKEVPAAVLRYAQAERLRDNLKLATKLEQVAQQIVELQPAEFQSANAADVDTADPANDPAKSVTDAEVDPEDLDAEP